MRQFCRWMLVIFLMVGLSAAMVGCEPPAAEPDESAETPPAPGEPVDYETDYMIPQSDGTFLYFRSERDVQIYQMRRPNQ